MKSGKSGALNRISASGKTWDMMKKRTDTPAMLENRYPPFYEKTEK